MTKRRSRSERDTFGELSRWCNKRPNRQGQFDRATLESFLSFISAFRKATTDGMDPDTRPNKLNELTAHLDRCIALASDRNTVDRMMYFNPDNRPDPLETLRALRKWADDAQHKRRASRPETSSYLKALLAMTATYWEANTHTPSKWGRWAKGEPQSGFATFASGVVKLVAPDELPHVDYAGRHIDRKLVKAYSTIFPFTDANRR